MKRFCCVLATLCIASWAATEAGAQGCHRGRSFGGFHGGFNYGCHSGNWYGGNYCSRPSCYIPYSYQSWSQYCWFPNYNCYGYYCPRRCSWFYYCPQFRCYLPISYMSRYQPIAFNGVTVNNTNVNTNVAGPGNVVGGAGLPAGAQPLPAASGPVMPGVTP